MGAAVGALVVAAGWVLLTAAGMVTLALLPQREQRDRLLPAAAALGAATLMVLLHLTSLVLPVRVGAPLVLVALLLVALHPAVRARLLHPTRSALVALLVCGLLAVPAVAIGLLPLRHSATATVVQPTPNNDAFAFVSEADWLLSHNAFESPSPTTAPGYDWVRRHVSQGLRIGQEQVIDTVAVVTRQPVERVYYPLTVLWLALIPGAVVAAGGLLGLRRGTAFVAGAVLSLGSLEMYQVLNENSTAALGVALAPLCVAVVAEFIDVGPSRPRLPLLAAPLALAAELCAYAEFLPLLLPAFLLIALARRPAQMLVALRRLVIVVVLSIAVSPLAWWHAAKGLTSHLDELYIGWASPFLSASPRQFAVRWIGGGDLVAFGTDRSSIAVLLFAVAVLGIAAACLYAPRRRVWVALLVASALLITYLSTVRRITYSEQRAVLYSQPLLLLAAAAGFDAVLQRGRALLQGTQRMVALLAVLAVATVFTAVNVRSSVAMARPSPDYVAHRTVDADFADAAQWARTYGGDDGSGVLVLSGDYFNQLWLVYELRTLPRASFATMQPDYLQIGNCHDAGPSRLWDGRPRPYLLVDRLSLLRMGNGAHVVAQNSRFAMVQTGPGWVLAAAVLPGIFPDSLDPRRVLAPVEVLLVSEGDPPGGAADLAFSNDGGAVARLRAGAAGTAAGTFALASDSRASVRVVPQGASTRVEVQPLDDGARGHVVVAGVDPAGGGAPLAAQDSATLASFAAPC